MLSFGRAGGQVQWPQFPGKNNFQLYPSSTGVSHTACPGTSVREHGEGNFITFWFKIMLSLS